MIKKSDYIRTDLAFESEVGAKKAHTVKEDFEGISLSVMTVDSDELSKLLKKDKLNFYLSLMKTPASLLFHVISNIFDISFMLKIC